MKKIIDKSENLRDVLAVFLSLPDEPLEILDIKKGNLEGSETTERVSLRRLENEKILEVTRSRGRPKGGYKIKNYKIATSLETFKKVFDIYYPNDIEQVLKSNYCNRMINSKKLYEVYGKIGVDLEARKLKQIASESLLSLPATIQEYKNYADSVYNNLEECAECHVYLRDMLQFFEIGILEDFDPIYAIPFYREHVVGNLVKLYRKIGGREISSRSEIVVKYNELDMHLSPFFSYPIYDPIQILLSKPFDRLYDDIYILDKDDLRLMAERIYLVYANFPEFLSLYLKGGYTILLEKSLKEYVFLWNCLSTYFRKFFFYFKGSLGKHSGKYHLWISNGIIQITDLVENKKFFDPFMVNQIKEKYLEYPPLYSGDFECGGVECDPFEALLPCDNLFNQFGFDTDPIPIESILSKLKSMIK